MSHDIDLSHAQLFAAGEDGDSLLDRWIAGRVDEDEERAVVALLLSSDVARQEARLRIALRQGTLAQAQSPLEIVVRAVRGALEALAGGLAPLPSPAVLVRGPEAEPAPVRSFDLDAVEPGLLLHLQGRGDRFRVDLELGRPPGHADWSLEGADGRHVAAEAEDGVRFPLVPAGEWRLQREGGRPVQLHLLVEE